MLFINKLENKSPLAEGKTVKLVIGTNIVVPVTYVTDASNKRMAYWKQGVIFVHGDRIGQDAQLHAGVLAHEAGHHHHWYVENNFSHKIHGWKAAFKQLLAEECLDGYAAKDWREGYAEAFRLYHGYHFDPNGKSTTGCWQYDPAKTKKVIQTWKKWVH